MTRYVEELGPLQSLTRVFSGANTGSSTATPCADDQFIRIESVNYVFYAAAAAEGLTLSAEGQPQGVDIVKLYSGAAQLLQGVAGIKMDTNLGATLTISTVVSNAGSAGMMNVTYRKVTVRQANGQPITPACTIWRRLLGEC